MLLLLFVAEMSQPISSLILFTLALIWINEIPFTGAIAAAVYVRSQNPIGVTSFEDVSSEHDVMDCGRRCSKFSHCVSWAFHAQTGTCCLHPTVRPDQEDGEGFYLYTDMAPACSESEAPVANTNVTWEHTLTSLISLTSVEVICPTDFLHLGITSPIRCLATGRWETDLVQCKQRIWRNLETSPGETYPVPKTPSVGWSVFLKATPLGNARFNVNLMTSIGHIMLHFDVRFNVRFDGVSYVRATVMDCAFNGAYGSCCMILADPNPPFPFRVGQQFALKLTATKGNEIKTYVNGQHYGTSRPLLAFVSDVTHVMFGNDVIDVETLDLWYP